MLSLKSKWKELKKKGIKLLSNAFAENIAKRTFDWLLGILIGGGTLGTVYLFLRDSVWNPAKNILQLKIELWIILLFALLVILLFLIINKIITWSKKPVFMDIMGTKIKISGGVIEKRLYCIEHKAPLIYRSKTDGYSLEEIYLCPFCGSERTKGLTYEKELVIYDVTKSQLEAVLNKGIVK